jgi:type VI secretion system protein ImpH
VLDESIGYFAAAIRHRPASSTQLARVLTEYFGQPVAAEQFVGHWYDVPPAQQTILGDATAVLGLGAMAGVRVWQRDLRLRLVIGPLDRASFDAFLPGGLAARALRAMLTLFTGVTLEYEVELVLRAADVREVPQGRIQHRPPGLGCLPGRGRPAAGPPRRALRTARAVGSVVEQAHAIPALQSRCRLV